jgi:pilus assembly protein CpaB
MNRNRLLLIGVIALALGGLAGLSVYRHLKPQNADLGSTAEVVVAANDLPVGKKIEDNDVKVVRLPVADLPQSVAHRKSSVIGRGVVLSIYKGEFIIPSKIAPENGGSGMPGLIPPGMRAVSVRVNEVVGVAGFVQPGTRVDVLWTGGAGGNGEQQTTTVLENVKVIATGQKLERNPEGGAPGAAVITLLVSPDDAQKLSLASSQGHIQLSLRNPLDTQASELAALRSSVLFKNGTPVPIPVVSRPRQKKAMESAPPPAPYQVEVIRGEKKDYTKFDQ